MKELQVDSRSFWGGNDFITTYTTYYIETNEVWYAAVIMEGERIIITQKFNKAFDERTTS